MIRYAAWPFTADEVERYSQGDCFLLAWALERVARRYGQSSGEVVLSWYPPIDERHACHAAYLTQDGLAVDARGAEPLGAYLARYVAGGWCSAVERASALVRDGYVYPPDRVPHDEALSAAERIWRVL